MAETPKGNFIKETTVRDESLVDWTTEENKKLLTLDTADLEAIIGISSSIGLNKPSSRITPHWRNILIATVVPAEEITKYRTNTQETPQKFTTQDKKYTEDFQRIYGASFSNGKKKAGIDGGLGNEMRQIAWEVLEKGLD